MTQEICEAISTNYRKLLVKDLDKIINKEKPEFGLLSHPQQSI
jgi:hypothetical protein